MGSPEGRMSSRVWNLGVLESVETSRGGETHVAEEPHAEPLGWAAAKGPLIRGHPKTVGPRL